MMDGNDHTRIRLTEILEDIKTLEEAIPDPLTLEPAIQNLKKTREAYDRLDLDDSNTAEGDR